MRKGAILFGILLLTISSLFADVFYNDCCNSQYGECNICNQCYDFGFWFDPMAVKPCQMPLEFAEQEVAASSTVNNNKDSFLHPGWSFGFKVGAGIRSQCSPWSFRADYVYWRNYMDSSLTLRGTGIVGPQGLITNLQPKIADTLNRRIFLPTTADTGTVSTSLRYSYNVFDATAGWSCCVCNGLELTPYGGFRGFWYSTYTKEISADSTGIAFSVEGDPSTVSNRYSAYGIVGGLRFNYNLFNCFNFYGWFGGSIVGGCNRNKIDFESRGVSSTAPTTPVSITFNETICLFVHDFEGGWGFTYDVCLCGFDTHIGLGYEVTQWNEVLPHPFRQNSTSPGNATKTSNGLFTQAITARFGVVF